MSDQSPNETVQVELVVGADSEYPVRMNVTASHLVDEEAGKLEVTLDDEGMDEYLEEFGTHP